ncbi:MAG: ABC transporter substrate-binding protein [Methylococcaceae bacterium]|jgi:oligopeptide transport system substrate-binding protein
MMKKWIVMVHRPATGWPFHTLILGALLALAGCGDPPNNPYPASDGGLNTLYSSFEERPKHLDPARAYSANEYEIIAQVYEPPLQYAYLTRPYQLQPFAAEGLPEVHYQDIEGKPLPDTAPDEQIGFSLYDIYLRPGLRYQPHPAFARDAAGQYRYHALRPAQLATLSTLADFPETDSRPVLAEDYAYQIRRLVHPEVHSPIAEMMAGYIVGLRELGERLASVVDARDHAGWLDLRAYPLAGVEVLDQRHLRIRLHGKYPQFRFWLAMPFFAPMPWEAEAFYAQPGLIAKNITLDWYPVGSGPYRLTENNPNRRMVLARNPHYHGEQYPTSGEPDDAARGYLADAGKSLPFIDRVVFVLEKETIPYWSKFLQGYYDASGLASDNFDQAIEFSGAGNAELTPQMQRQGIRLQTAVSASTFYLGFNMLDPVVGGLDERKAKLRQAISIAIDEEEFIAIFMNGRGVAAQGMLPPGLFGHEAGRDGINPYVYEWVNDQARRKSLTIAKSLLAEAGYPNGLEPATGKPLALYLDTTSSGVDDKSVLNWYRKQLAKLGIQLVLRTTDYNQFQQKMANGNAQLFRWGWNADYPDPENFFFLLFGDNAKVGKGGENAANYRNPEYDRLFIAMRGRDDGPARLALIRRMQAILQHDAPWVFGIHPKNYSLSHAWYHNFKPNLMANNGLKYLRIDAAERARRRADWNRPVYWPLAVALAIGLAVVFPAWRVYRRRLRATAL